MSSSGIDSINSGPLLIRTYNDSSVNNTILLGTYDIPISSNYVLITSSNGTLAPSNNIYVSSISASSILSNTISVSTVNVSTLFFSTIIGSTIFTNILTYSSLIGSSISTNILRSNSIITSTLFSSSIYTNFESISSLRVSSINSQPYAYYWSNTGPTGLSTNAISNASNTGPTGAVQAGTGSIYSIYGMQDNVALNGDVGITNNLLVCGSTTYPDGSVAISNNPALLYSNNIIFTPSSQNELSSLTWSSSAISASGQYQTAVINGGFIYYSTDYGITWNKSNSISGTWTSVAMSSSGQYQTGVINGSIYYSINYGVNWTESSSPTANWKSNAMSSSGQYQTAVINGGFIYYSTNYGINWTQSISPTSTLNWTSVAMSSSGQYQTAVINGGFIYYSSNYGINWNKSISISGNWTSIAMSSSGQYQTAAINVGIYYSSNYGVNWTQSSSISDNWTSVTVSSSGQYQAAVINGGRIYYSSDYGKTLIELNIFQSWVSVQMSSSGQYITALANTIYRANIPIPSTSYLTNTNLILGNVRQNPESTGSIVLNASNITMTGFTGSRCYINPIRNLGTQSTLHYNPTTSEVTYGAKTFVIDHPLDSSKYLVHACIEGPEAGVYYRGTSEIENGKREQIVTLPEYVKSLATSFTVTITPIYNGKIRYLNCSDVTNNFFTVYGKPGRFHWIIFGKRLDIQVEPYKNEVRIKGDGPYKYI